MNIRLLFFSVLTFILMMFSVKVSAQSVNFERASVEMRQDNCLYPSVYASYQNITEDVMWVVYLYDENKKKLYRRKGSEYATPSGHVSTSLIDTDIKKKVNGTNRHIVFKIPLSVIPLMEGRHCYYLSFSAFNAKTNKWIAQLDWKASIYLTGPKGGSNGYYAYNTQSGSNSKYYSNTQSSSQGKVYTVNSPHYSKDASTGHESYTIGRLDSNGKWQGWVERRIILDTHLHAVDIGLYKDSKRVDGYYLAHTVSATSGKHYYSYYDSQSYNPNGYPVPKDANDCATLEYILKKMEDVGKKHYNTNPFPNDGFLRNVYATSSTSSTSTSSSSTSNNESSGTAVAVAGLAAIIYGLIKGAQAIDKTIENTQKAQEREEAERRRQVDAQATKSMNNVEIVDWWTFNWLAISHAKVQLRNKNNYDVNVTVGLYQGKWSNGKIIYNGREQSDYIPGVSDDYSTTIRVKANSIRMVYLKADNRGRPTNIRISSVR